MWKQGSENYVAIEQAKMIYELQEENKELKAKKDEYYLETLDYERANSILVNCLEEIKEMRKYDCEYECSNDCEKCIYTTCLEQRIQRKIDEVLNGYKKM